MKNIYIGFFNNSKNQYPEFPMVEQVEPYPNGEHVIKVKAVLAYGEVIFYKGWSTCRIYGCINGSTEYRIKFGDSLIHVPEGYIHYMEEHYLRPDPRLLKIWDSIP